MASWKKVVVSGSAGELSSLALDTALPLTSGGVGATTAAGARGTLGLASSDNVTFNKIDLGNASDATLTRTGAGDFAVEGQTVYRVGGTDVAVADGGTGAGTASGARTNLGLAIGSDVQAFDAQLADIAGLSPTDGNIIIGNGANFVLESGATARASLGLTIGTHVQAFDAQLTDIAGLTPTDGNVIIGDGNNFVLESGATARTSLGLGAASNVDFQKIEASSHIISNAAQGRISGSSTSTGSFGSLMLRANDSNRYTQVDSGSLAPAIAVGLAYAANTIPVMSGTTANGVLTFNAAGSATVESGVKISNDDLNIEGTSPSLQITDSSDSNWTSIRTSDGGITTIQADSDDGGSGEIRLLVGAQGGAVDQKAVLKYNGAVGIGTALPVNAGGLHVWGNISGSTINGTFTGDGSALTGVNQDVDGLSELSAAPATTDMLLLSDSGTEKKLSVANLAGGVFGILGGDITTTANGNTTIAANAVEDGMVNDNVATGLAGAGMTATSGVMNVIAGNGISVAADAVSLNLDGSTLTNGGSGVKVSPDLSIASLTLSGDLTVNGTTTTLATTNLAVKDAFIYAASGSHGSNVDGGLIVQHGATTGTGAALYHDNGDNRWAVAKAIAHTATSVTALEYVVTAKALGDNDAPTDSDDEYGVGEMALNNNGDIWIYSGT